jgi:hypothetical protein
VELLQVDGANWPARNSQPDKWNTRPSACASRKTGK